MEDALVHIPTEYIEDIVGLNPCFNGRCTSTVWIKLFVALLQS